MFSSLQVIFVILLLVFVLVGTITTYLSVYGFYASISGQEYLGIHEHAGETLSVIQEAALSVALQEGIIIFAMFLFLGLIVFFIMYKYIIRPVRKLYRAMEKVSEEDFNVHLAESGSGSISKLAKTFNKMIFRLKQSRERIERSAKVKSEFILIAAHQLRTPLSEFKWGINELTEERFGRIKPEQKEVLDAIYQNNEGMISLVNNILSIAEAEKDGLGYNIKFENIKDTVKEQIDSLALMSKRKNLEIVVNSPEQELPKLKIDKFQIGLVLKSLLENAINYSNSGDKIEVNILIVGKFVEIGVRDFGVGISKEELNHIFTRFFRGKKSMEKQPIGSGLGLFISRNIIKGHGGNIWAESKEGEGSTFYFSLPIDPEMVPKEKKYFEEFIINLFGNNDDFTDEINKYKNLKDLALI